LYKRYEFVRLAKRSAEPGERFKYSPNTWQSYVTRYMSPAGTLSGPTPTLQRAMADVPALGDFGLSQMFDWHRVAPRVRLNVRARMPSDRSRVVGTARGSAGD